ncbi:hypothetical protein G9C85_07720 [Halorubellus sp. JP-L1]|uniref:hypothetical protein n=1 Tax=Halorubellus sp. JP-L1 TaxID=2715753 RepID=UPI00140A5208|nr:hypothetical protein [Halorubellus sp. JP-L1]NHN41525.1 hypothetical protein [Halorubellus sp. JP-L1]
MKDHPFPEPVLSGTANAGVVRAERLAELLSVVQADLSLRLETYRDECECAYEDDRLVAFFVDGDRWAAIADRLGFEPGAVDATRSAHARLLVELGAGVGRRDEFTTALDDADCVVVDKTTS